MSKRNATLTSGAGDPSRAPRAASSASLARARARAGRNYRAPRNEMADALARLASSAPGGSFESRASRELRERIAGERSTVLLAPDGSPARLHFRREEIPGSRPRELRTLAIPEPGSVRSDAPAIYSRSRSGRIARAGFGESVRSA